MNQRRSRYLAATPLLMALLLSGCGESATEPQFTVAAVTVHLAPAELSVGETGHATATTRDAGSNILHDRSVQWTSSNAAVATVSPGGQILAGSPGSASIRAQSEGVIGAATVTVTQAPVSSVSLNFATVAMDVGDVRVLVVTVRDGFGNTLRNREVRWTSSDIDVVAGTVAGDTAFITGVSSGTAFVRAEVERHSAVASVTVRQTASGLCSQIAGASVYGHDGEFVGRFLSEYHAQSILNPYGSYGSPYSSTSTNNPYGTYGSPYSSLSARNPYTSTPPVIVQNGQTIAYYSVNPYLSFSVSPDAAMNCTFY